MLVYEENRHDESMPQVCALERSSEGIRLNKLIREKNPDRFLPVSVGGAYMKAAEGLASEVAKTPMRQGFLNQLQEPVTNESIKEKFCPDRNVQDAKVRIILVLSEFIGSTLTSIRIPRLNWFNLLQVSGITTIMVQRA